MGFRNLIQNNNLIPYLKINIKNLLISGLPDIEKNSINTSMNKVRGDLTPCAISTISMI